MSTSFRICRMKTDNLEKIRAILRSSKCASKTGLPKICVGDVFYMKGGPPRKKQVPPTYIANYNCFRHRLPYIVDSVIVSPSKGIPIKATL